MIRDKRRYSRSSARWKPPRVTEVRQGSPCGGLVEVGDHLLKINGRPPLDIIDYMESSEERRVSLRLLREEKEVVVKVRKEGGTPLGLVFEEAVFDGARTCRNNCIFCFVDQMPPGLRPSLYIKDDDYRLSFYYGNFITLNNLSWHDLCRIARLRLSPLYVSLHSTDAGLRDYLMGGNAGAGLEALDALLEEGIELHLQVVVCPGVNDGDHLRRTFEDVLGTYTASSLGVVPLGMTSCASDLPAELKPHDLESSLQVLELVDEYQDRALERHGRRLFHAADEFYLLAGRDFPAEKEYEGYPQLENGVGMARKFVDEALKAAGAGAAPVSPGRGVLTGVAGEKVIGYIVDSCTGGRKVETVVVRNKLFGEKVTVTGLLAGRDIIAALRESGVSSRELLVPRSMLREGRFIDDLDLEDVRRETGICLVPVEVDGALFMQRLCGEEGGA